MPTLERRDPLPPGRYWVDVVGANIPVAQAWFAASRGAGVKVVRTEMTDASNPLIGPSSPAVMWALFDVAQPTPGYPARLLGAPTIVRQTAAVSSSGKPIDERVTQQSDTTVVPSTPTVDVEWLIPIAVFGGLLWALLHHQRNNHGP